MKRRQHRYLVFLNMHRWMGISACCLLFVIFYAGIFSLFHDELTRWQERLPESTTHIDIPIDDAYQRAYDILKSSPLLDGVDKIQLEYNEQTGLVHCHTAGDADDEFSIDLATSSIHTPRSQIADTLFELHFLRPIPGGEVLAGFLAIVLLSLIVSGVVLHFKNLPQKLWTIRNVAKTRTWTSDLHKVLGTFGIPFLVAMAWSGAILGLGGWILAGIGMGAYNGDREKMLDIAGFAEPAASTTSPEQNPAPRVNRALERARDFRSNTPDSLRIRNLRHGQVTIEVRYRSEEFQNIPSDWFNASGELIAVKPSLSEDKQSENPNVKFLNWLYTIHFARFGGIFNKFIFVLLALFSCVVFCTGNLIWLEKASTNDRSRTINRWVLRITIGTCIGLIFAISVYFLMHKLLPAQLENRAAQEQIWFFGSWIAALGFSCLPRWRPVVLTYILLTLAGIHHVFLFASEWSFIRSVPANTNMLMQQDAIVLASLHALIAGCITCTIFAVTRHRSNRPLPSVSHYTASI